MPSTDDKTRAQYYANIGEDVGDGEDYLVAAGYSIINGWIYPPINHTETPMEALVITYLCEEWDYAFKERK